MGVDASNRRAAAWAETRVSWQADPTLESRTTFPRVLVSTSDLSGAEYRAASPTLPTSSSGCSGSGPYRLGPTVPGRTQKIRRRY